MKLKRVYEVGDKVRFVEQSYGATGMKGRFASVGEVGTIIEVDAKDDGIPYNVDIGGGSVWATASNIELVVEPARGFECSEKPTKFAVGDRVRLICVTMGIRSGTEGVVTGERDGGVIVRFDSHVWPTNGNDNGWWVLDSDIELIEAVDESSTPAHDHNDDSGVTRTIGAVVAGLTFAITGSEVTISNGGAIAAMTLAQFNEVHRILNEEAR